MNADSIFEQLKMLKALEKTVSITVHGDVFVGTVIQTGIFTTTIANQDTTSMIRTDQIVAVTW